MLYIIIPITIAIFYLLVCWKNDSDETVIQDDGENKGYIYSDGYYRRIK